MINDKFPAESFLQKFIKIESGGFPKMDAVLFYSFLALMSNSGEKEVAVFVSSKKTFESWSLA